MSNRVKFSSLWQSLVDDGYNVGTYEEFLKKLKDSSKVSSLESFQPYLTSFVIHI